MAISAISILIDTAPSGPPTDFAITVNMTSLMCSWSPPDETSKNGDIISYTLTCITSNKTVIDLTLKATIFQIYVDLFSSATVYSCSIAASNLAGIGPSSTLSVITEGKITNPYKQIDKIFFLQKLLSLPFHSSHWVLNMALE